MAPRLEQQRHVTQSAACACLVCPPAFPVEGSIPPRMPHLGVNDLNLPARCPATGHRSFSNRVIADLG